MIRKVLNAHRRFILNMDRIAGLMKLVMSDEGEFKPTGFMTYEGVSADIFRLLSILCMRVSKTSCAVSLPGKGSFSFQSGIDIDKALRSAGFDPSPLKLLYRPLTAMAKRRNRIVHGADFVLKSSTDVEPWGVADLWQILHWNFAVFRSIIKCLLFSPGHTRAGVFLEKYNNARKAMDEH